MCVNTARWGVGGALCMSSVLDLSSPVMNGTGLGGVYWWCWQVTGAPVRYPGQLSGGSAGLGDGVGRPEASLCVSPSGCLLLWYFWLISVDPLHPFLSQ